MRERLGQWRAPADHLGLGVGLYSCRGQSSKSFAYEAMQQYAHQGKGVTVIFGGDWEPTGRCIPRSVVERMERYGNGEQLSNKEAVALFAAEGAFDPETTRAALAACQAPVLLFAGELDLNSPLGRRPSSRHCSPTPRSWCSRERATTPGSTTPTSSWRPLRHSWDSLFRCPAIGAL
ncbi:hypothetical protein [Streptomyces scopuliridis]|uniref:hypothetical protein n=1 Tax=Streptomyces scopuliridis TaxID=452529 RepID=UPI003697CB48